MLEASCKRIRANVVRDSNNIVVVRGAKNVRENATIKSKLLILIRILFL